MKNAINWFEIAVMDFERARIFYETVLGSTINVLNLGEGFKMGLLGADPDGVGGAIVWHAAGFYKPSADGALIYLNGDPDLSVMLDRVETAGGKIVIAKRQISEEFGYMGIFTDSEGNRIALHSNG
jgi:predicted enzyme related to lactoylglutathione lyase